MKILSISYLRGKIPRGRSRRFIIFLVMFLFTVFGIFREYGFIQKSEKKEQIDDKIEQRQIYGQKPPPFIFYEGHAAQKKIKAFQEKTEKLDHETNVQVVEKDKPDKAEEESKNDEDKSDKTASMTFEKQVLINYEQEKLKKKYERLSEALVSEIATNCPDEFLELNEEISSIDPIQPEPNTYDRVSPATDYELKLGSKIPAILETGINSQIPGMITGIVSSNVYDSATGKHLLIPQGSQLVGRYESNILYGQTRVMAVWTRLNFPDATHIDLPLMSGTDLEGQSGFKDKVNNHYFRIFANATMLSLISTGVKLAVPDSLTDNSVRDEAMGSLAETLGEVTSEILRKNMNIAPTINIRSGYNFNVMVNRDIPFSKPYGN